MIGFAIKPGTAVDPVLDPSRERAKRGAQGRGLLLEATIPIGVVTLNRDHRTLDSAWQLVTRNAWNISVEQRPLLAAMRRTVSDPKETF